MEIIEGITLNDLLQRLGIHSSWLLSTLEFSIRILFIAIVAWLTYFIARKWLAKIVVKLAGRTDTRWDDLMFDQRFFNYFAFFITPIVIRMVSFQIGLEYLVVINKVIDIWIVFAVAFLLSVVMDGVNRIYNSYPVARNRPIKVFIQVIKIFVYCVVTVIVFSIILGKDPEALLVGLSAFAAVLMLIFKDAILGFVAGVQLIANKMVNLGDWIVMPSANADGEVLEINLTTVKVQNWDKTISTIPTYKMVSESFTNWRGMEESNGRRIKRSVNIDVQSIHYLTPGEIEQLAKSELLKDYILTKKAELDINYADASTPLDGIRMTNIGTFREYMELWIAQNPNIAQNMTHMVRQLQPGPTGVPLEIYCFSARQKWVEYEKVQSDLFDHLYAVVPLFNLRLFQYPSDKWVAEGDNF
ncbi:mechanosensitive ion channel domain-containing protein [uncultured Culturomica sp.]|uniref:mechanosensitive ion channel family protein n=1 Tax=uncultured Culturomica sp. TaxID=1926654 RepID=UPI00033DFE4F|nr:mechanosensitive ion channel domain-containing protein [uncultured Culturomica sp.]CCZ09277.1 mscS Mechanosensitive ion channel [Odoribacter sp. CAG:788]